MRILMQSVPPGIDVGALEMRIGALPGVAGVHDLHVWTLTSGIETASGHVTVADGAEYHGVLDAVADLLRTAHGITHATIQCEPAGHQEPENPV